MEEGGSHYMYGDDLDTVQDWLDMLSQYPRHFRIMFYNDDTIGINPSHPSKRRD